MSLNLLMKKTFPGVKEANSILKVFDGSICHIFKFQEIGKQWIRNRCYRYYFTGKEKDKVVKFDTPEGDRSTTAFETVKETTRTLTYSGIIAIGLGITGIICYAIFSELFSRNSPMNIYSKALDRCLKSEKVILSLGEPIVAFGEENSRGRRIHTNHMLYKKEGVNHLRMKFYVKGIRNKATVHLEMRENENKNFEYRYLFVQLDEFPYTTIVLEDNRGEKASFVQPLNGKLELT